MTSQKPNSVHVSMRKNGTLQPPTMLHLPTRNYVLSWTAEEGIAMTDRELDASNLMYPRHLFVEYDPNIFWIINRDHDVERVRDHVDDKHYLVFHRASKVLVQLNKALAPRVQQARLWTEIVNVVYPTHEWTQYFDVPVLHWQVGHKPDFPVLTECIALPLHGNHPLHKCQERI